MHTSFAITNANFECYIDSEVYDFMIIDLINPDLMFVIIFIIRIGLNVYLPE